MHIKAPKGLYFKHKQRPKNRVWSKPENAAFYKQKLWTETSKAYRHQNPLCENCLEKGFTSETWCTDHIIPIEEGGDKWDWDNFQALCKSCHGRKTGRETAERVKNRKNNT